VLFPVFPFQLHRRKPAIRDGLKSREKSAMKTRLQSTTNPADAVCRG
jgi:hypothetical protein